MNSLTLAIAVVIAVALLGLVLRRAAMNTPAMAAPQPDPLDRPDEDAPPDAFDELLEPAEVAALTSDGWAFLPTRDPDRVAVVPPREPEDPGAPPARRPVRTGAESLVRGELIAARVRRGAPDHDPWRLEALGRESEYQSWRFETEQAARAALDLIERCVVEPPRDEDGEIVPATDADFAAARREQEAIEAELASLPEPEDEPPKGFLG
jgi:hypothetical protein